MTATLDSARNSLVRELPLEQIEPSDFNPRTQFHLAGLQELAESIKRFGLIEPIVVRTQRSLADGSPLDDAFEIIAGERRYRAAMLAGVDTIPAMIRDVDDVTALRMAITENLERRDLDPIEEARGYQLLAERAGMKQKAIAEAVNRSQPAVANALRLLELPEDVQERIRNGELSRAHGVALASLKDFPAFVSTLATIAVEERRTSKDLEKPFESIGGYKLEPTGLVRMINTYNAPFDISVCQTCPFNAYRSGPEWQHSKWCLKPEHFDELVAAAQSEQQAQMEAKLTAAGTDPDAVLKLSELTYDQYERISEYSSPPAGCSDDCPCRTAAQDASGRLVAICTDPARMRKLKTAESRATKAAKRAAGGRELEQITAHLDMLEAASPVEIGLLCAQLLTRVSKPTIVKAAVERHLGDVLSDFEWRSWEIRQRQELLDRVAALEPALLVKATIEALLSAEVADRIEGVSYGTLTDWYLHRIGVEPPADGEVEA